MLQTSTCLTNIEGSNMKTVSQIMYRECKYIRPNEPFSQLRMALACWIGGCPLADTIVLRQIRKKIMLHAKTSKTMESKRGKS